LVLSSCGLRVGASFTHPTAGQYERMLMFYFIDTREMLINKDRIITAEYVPEFNGIDDEVSDTPIHRQSTLILTMDAFTEFESNAGITSISKMIRLSGLAADNLWSKLMDGSCDISII
jgi:hypothetical protein